MKKIFLSVILIIVSVAGIFVVVSHTRNDSTPKKKVYRATAIRRHVKYISVSDVKEIVIVIPSQRIIVNKKEDIRALLNGLKSAVWPCDPERLPGNRTLSVKIILRNGQTVGPFGFSNETPNMAFGKKFAKAYNDLNPRIKVNMLRE